MSAQILIHELDGSIEEIEMVCTCPRAKVTGFKAYGRIVVCGSCGKEWDAVEYELAHPWVSPWKVLATLAASKR